MDEYDTHIDLQPWSRLVNPNYITNVIIVH